MDDMRKSMLCNDTKLEQVSYNNIRSKRSKENMEMTENDSVVECSLDVLAPDTTDMKVEGLTIQVRKYFCFKLSDSLLRNFRNSEGIKNRNLARENIQYIARNKEFDIFQESKNIVEYKFSMIKQTFEFEKQAIDQNISQILKLNNADFIKENNKWGPYFNVGHNRYNVTQSHFIKIKPITIRSDNPVTNKLRFLNTDVQSSKFIKDVGNEASNLTVNTKSVDGSKGNNEDRRSQCLRIIDNVLLSTQIAIKRPALSSTQEKKDINIIRHSDSINTNTDDQIKNSKHIENKVVDHNSQEEKYSVTINEKYKTSCEPFFQKQEENFTCSPRKKRPRLENNLQLELSDPHIWTKQALNMLKLILKNFYKTSYIPNKDSYKMICRKIYTDILDKKIYEQEHIKLYAEDAVKSKKYLPK